MAIFKEQQHMAPSLRLVSAGLVVLVMAGVAVAVLSDGERAGDELVPLVIAVLASAVAVILVLVMRLDLRISEKTIEYQLFPLEWRARTIRLDDVLSMDVGNFGFLPKYGGFGRRRKPWKKEVAYILNRKACLTVKLKDGRTRIFSTSERARLERFVRSTMPHLAAAKD